MHLLRWPAASCLPAPGLCLPSGVQVRHSRGAPPGHGWRIKPKSRCTLAICLSLESIITVMMKQRKANRWGTMQDVQVGKRLTEVPKRIQQTVQNNSRYVKAKRKKNVKDTMIPSYKNITEADPDFTVAVIMCIFLSQLMSCLSYDEKSWTRPKMEEKLLQLLHMLTGTKLLRVLMKAIRFCDLWVWWCWFQKLSHPGGL